MSHLVRAALAFLVFAPAGSAAPVVARLRTQKVGEATYFLVAIAPPKDLAMPKPPGISRVSNSRVENFSFGSPSEGSRRAVVQVPRLVPLDGQTTKLHFAGFRSGDVIFLGRRVGDEPTASCRLFYPVAAAPTKDIAGLPGDRAGAHLGCAHKPALAQKPPTLP